MINVIDKKTIQEEKEKQGRQLNFELLRIVSMILIVLHHYNLHSGLVENTQIGVNQFIGQFINIGGKLGAITFIIITGYFMIESRFKVKKLVKIILEVFFYSVVIMVILLLTNNINFSVKELIKNIFPISYGQY